MLLETMLPSNRCTVRWANDASCCECVTIMTVVPSLFSSVSRFITSAPFFDYGTGDGYTLLLSAGELLGKVFGTVADVHAFQYFLYPLFPFCGLVAEVGQRQFYVLEDIEFVYQVETLEDEAYLALAYTGTVFLVSRAGWPLLVRTVCSCLR